MKVKLIPEAKQIIPKWEKKIRKENYNAEFGKAPVVYSLADFRFCVVGEAHGLNDDYMKKCDICWKFSYIIGTVFEKAKMKRSPASSFYIIDPKTIKPYMIERLISRTNRFLEHFIKVHKKG